MIQQESFPTDFFKICVELELRKFCVLLEYCHTHKLTVIAHSQTIAVFDLHLFEYVAFVVNCSNAFLLFCFEAYCLVAKNICHIKYLCFCEEQICLGVSQMNVLDEHFKNPHTINQLPHGKTFWVCSFGRFIENLEYVVGLGVSQKAPLVERVILGHVYGLNNFRVIDLVK